LIEISVAEYRSFEKESNTGVSYKKKDEEEIRKVILDILGGII
jgi:hypothetical protein